MMGEKRRCIIISCDKDVVGNVGGDTPHCEDHRDEADEAYRDWKLNV